MFSDLPNLFDRNFVTGYLLPAILFGLVSIFIISISFGFQFINFQLVSSQPNGFQTTLVVKDTDSAYFLIAIFTISCLIMAVSLLMLNRLFIRLLEGYLPPLSWFKGIAIWGFIRFKNQLEKITTKYITEQEKGSVTLATKKKYRELLLKNYSDYPDQEQFLLATSFGNIIRAAEVYPRSMYGADLIPIWPRLLSVIDKDYKEYIDGAKAGVDFAVNIFYICIALTVETVILFLLSPNASTVWKTYWPIPLSLLLSIFMSYRLTVSRAREWGLFLRSASDLYISPLLEKLKITPPVNTEERKALLLSISRSFLYNDPLPDQKSDKDINYKPE